jgi:transcriptional regulator with XRE-family HTH domain
MTNVSTSPLRHDIVRLLQKEREAAGLTPAELATKAGVSAASVTKTERGTAVPSVENLEKLFTALGLRLRLSVEPADDAGAQGDKLAWLPLTTRLERAGVAQLLRTLDAEAIPYVIDGGLAATLQDVQLPVEALEIDVAWRDVNAFTGWLIRRLAYRWHDTRGEFRLMDLDPRAPGPHYWQTSIGKVRARMVDELPASIEIRIGNTPYKVRPVAEVERFRTAPSAA